MLLIVLIEQCWHMAPKEKPIFIQICKNLQVILKNNFQVQSLVVFWTTLFQSQVHYSID